MSMITRAEAEQVAEKWVRDSAPPEPELTAALYEFDLGYVVWGRPPANYPPLVGAGRGIIDRETGDLSVWPALPVEMVIERFRARRVERPPAPRTRDPAEQLRRDLKRVAAPASVAHLSLADQVIVSRSVKGDVAPNHHRLVREFFADGPAPQFRERGYDRCAEASAFSDALHAEDFRRSIAGQPPLTLAQARTDFFAGASIVTYRVREAGDPVAGEPGLPCISCALLGRHLGFRVSLPGAGDDG
jgi:hypothetical protein